MNEKKSYPNEAYYDSQMRSIWLQYHEPDIEEFQVSAKEVK